LKFHFLQRVAGRMVKTAKKGGRKVQEPLTRDYTVHLHKYVHKVQFKKRAPKAIKTIKRFAARAMFTRDVRIDTKLNKFIWSNGVRNVPRRVRIRCSRKRNEDEEAKYKTYTLVQVVPVESFKNLQTETVRDD
jgi:large subunit ribosomal protein L31e